PTAGTAPADPARADRAEASSAASSAGAAEPARRARALRRAATSSHRASRRVVTRRRYGGSRCEHDPLPLHRARSPAALRGRRAIAARRIPGARRLGTVSKLRAWQAEALELYRDRAPKDFLAVATPGAGKTTFALQIAAGLLAEGTVRRI